MHASPDEQTQLEDRRPERGTAVRPERRVRRLATRFATVLLVLTTLGLTFSGGAWLALRSTVRVPTVAVPQLVDLGSDEARRELDGLGLRLEIGGARVDPIKAEGRVLEQSPRAGAETKPGRAVRVIVSSGPENTPVPDMIGSSLRRSQIALSKAGFRLETRAAVPHETVPVGRIIAQHPDPGRVGLPGEGASVLLSAGRASRGYVMPSLAGWAVEEAEGALERAGFKRVRTRGAGRSSRDDARRIVVSQEPPAGHRVTLETPVALTEGIFRPSSPLTRSSGATGSAGSAEVLP